MVSLISAVLGGGVAGLIAHRGSGTGGTGGPVTIGSTGADKVVERPPGSIASVAQRILPSVVSIQVKTGDSGDTGSGIVLSTSGYILTNNHVVAAVKKGGKLSVVLPDEKQVAASVIGHPDTVNDLAVVKVSNVRGLRPATLGDSNDLAVGDTVLAVGSPLGLVGTVTSGIISSLDRPVEAGGEPGLPDDVIDAIQTDAAINPGNSGGPLVDASGAVVGVNSAIASLSSGSALGGQQQSGSIGLGFAIPIDQAKRIASEIISRGYATHAIIGVGLDASYTGSGARIGGPTGVSAGGPAAKVGLHKGDVITALDGQPVTTANELIIAIRRHTPGTQVRLTYSRGGTQRTVTLTLGSALSE
jgi:putative serine protease PepD